MDLFDLVLSIMTSPVVPGFVQKGIARGAVGVFRSRLEREDRRIAAALPAAPSPAGALYLVDGYHGGAVFWDWLVLSSGGLWYVYNWPLCIQPALERAARDQRLKVVLDLDAYTFEDMARKDPLATEGIRRAVAGEQLEIVNGTYAQPLALATSGESFIRQLGYGLTAIREALGAEVRVFYSQEPAYYPQLPQLLVGFGYEAVVLRTQWAAFGTDPAEDATLVQWQGPDGSAIPTVPRYSFQGYDRQRATHPGLANMSLSAGDLPDWEPESLAPFEQAASERGIVPALVTDLKDASVPDAPWSRALEAAAMDHVRFTTIAAYLTQLEQGGPTVSYEVDDFGCTLPWGLQSDTLLRVRASAEAALLTAERLDAVSLSFGGKGQEQRLDHAWKQLCLAQHHDLQVCGPWHSRKHNCSMGEVGQMYAETARLAAVEVAEGSLDLLAAQAGGNLVVFNPAAWRRREYLEGTIGCDVGADLESEGTVFAGQCVAASGGTRTLGFVIDLPPLGYRCFDLLPSAEGASAPRRLVRLEGHGADLPACGEFENAWYAAEVREDGSFSLRTEAGPVVTAGNYYTVWRDGRWYDSRQGISSVICLADGPVLRRIRVEGELAGVRFWQLTTLYHGLPRIDVQVTFEFGTEGQYLGPQMADDHPGRAMSIQDEKKLCAVLASPLARVCSDSPFLVTTTGQESFAGLRWAGLEGDDGAGVALLNRGTQGYHFDKGQGELRNVLAWGPEEWIYASDNSINRGRSRYTALRGRQVFEYSFLAFASRGEAQRAALAYNLPCLSRWLCGTGGDLPRAGSFMLIEPQDVLLTALFAHRGRIYARLWNCSAEPTEARLTTAGGQDLRAVRLDLGEGGPFLAAGRIPLRPWGVQTVEVGRLGLEVQSQT